MTIAAALPRPANALVPKADYSDAPGYPTACHLQDTFGWLGQGVSHEWHPRATDTYDDGLSWSFESLVPGQQFDLTVTVTMPYNYRAYVLLWCDWDQDHDFADDGQLARLTFQSPITGSGYTQLSKTVTLMVPSYAELGTTWLRARYTDEPRLSSPYGTDAFGEVEDYRIVITPELAPWSLVLCTLLCALFFVRRRGTLPPTGSFGASLPYHRKER